MLRRRARLAATTGLLMACSVAAQAQQPVGFVHANVIPMDSDRVLPDQTLLVEGGRITAMGPTATVPVPAGARLIDARGRYLLPGLADMHVHLLGDSSELLLYLANGVTTVRDLSGELVVLGWRDEIRAGRRIGPRLVVASPIINAGSGRRVIAWRWGGAIALASVLLALWLPVLRRVAPQRLTAVSLSSVAGALAAALVAMRTVVPLPDFLFSRDEVSHLWVGSPGDAGRTVRSAAARYDQIKLYEKLSPAEFRAAVSAARAAGSHTVAHPPLGMPLAEALHAGLDELAHAYFLVVDLQAAADTSRVTGDSARATVYARRLDEIVAEVRRAGTGVTTTLMPVPELLERYTDSASFLARGDMRYRTTVTRRRLRGEMTTGASATLLHELREHARWGDSAVFRLSRAGVPLALGTDASPVHAVAGFSAHEELERLASGMSGYEALRTATLNAARVAGGPVHWGAIRPGFAADLLLLPSDPRTDVTATRQPLGVMAAGRWYDRAALDSMLATVVSRRAGSGRDSAR